MELDCSAGARLSQTAEHHIIDISWRLCKWYDPIFGSPSASTTTQHSTPKPFLLPLHVLLQFLKPNVLLGKCLGIDPVMIASSLRRAVRSHTSPQSISRPTTPSIAASLSSPSHQRRQSSSKPPIPPNDGPANITNPAVKTVGTPRSKDAAGQKRAGAESRLSRRKIPRDRSEHAPEGKDEWAINLPSVPSTQHLDPKGNDS